ncbi:MAG: DUF190 domain-containing protein [Pseudomonadota bacterium]
MTKFKLLRIYTDAASYSGDRKSLEVIAALARERGVAGITIIEALLGFGKSAHLHRHHVFESDRAVVIEIVDEEERLRAFAQALREVTGIGLATLEEVEILFQATTPDPHRPDKP